MSFRALEINKPSELHIHHHVLEIQQEDQILRIPVDDCSVIIASGPDVRLSANDLSYNAAVSPEFIEHVMNKTE